MNEFTITCSTLKQDKIQFVDNLQLCIITKRKKPYLYYNHFLPSNAKPKLFIFKLMHI